MEPSYLCAGAHCYMPTRVHTRALHSLFRCVNLQGFAIPPWLLLQPVSQAPALSSWLASLSVGQ